MIAALDKVGRAVGLRLVTDPTSGTEKQRQKMLLDVPLINGDVRVWELLLARGTLRNQTREIESEMGH